MHFWHGDPAAAPLPARAVNDEIQVYNAEIAKVGQWTFQLHSNYAFSGRKEPDFPGGIIPNHALNGTGEWVASSRFPFPYVADQDSPGPKSGARALCYLVRTRRQSDRAAGVAQSRTAPMALEMRSSFPTMSF